MSCPVHWCRPRIRRCSHSPPTKVVVVVVSRCTLLKTLRINDVRRADGTSRLRTKQLGKRFYERVPDSSSFTNSSGSSGTPAPTSLRQIVSMYSHSA